MNSPASVPRGLPTWLILLAALAAGTGLWLGSWLLAPAKLANAVLYPQAREVADFSLTQANGKPLARADWQGHWTIVYFGYTNCPDVCPTTLAAFKQTWKDLARRDLDKRVQLHFISVDPQRDTPEALGKYVAFFNPAFVAATGSDEQLKRLGSSLGLAYSRDKDANGNVTVDHSGSAVIIDPQARMIGMFRPPFDHPEIIAADLAALLARGT